MPDAAFRFESAVDRLSLQVYAWNAVAPPRGVIVIAHGSGEHALRYERFARALGATGFVTVALDHRGHGQSVGPGGLGDFGQGGWEGLIADLGQLITHVRSEHPTTPLVLFAHSMGSFAAQQYCFDHSTEIDGLVLSGSGAWESPKPGQTPHSFAPNSAFEPVRTPYDWLSRDRAEVDRYMADPLCGFEMQSFRKARADLLALGTPERIARIRPELPVLLVAGEADPVNRGMAGLELLERRWRAAGIARIDTLYYPGGRHEMLNETNRDEVTSDITAWLTEICPR